MIKRCFIIVCFMLAIRQVHSQDLNARVQILSPQVQNTNKQPLKTLETVIRDFLNNRKWSTDKFQPQERIDCNFVINITEWDGSATFKAEAQIQSSRPVYGTTYNSTLLNISDKDFNFSYSEGQPLDYSDQTYGNNLSSLLAFYAYVIVGLDYDSFAKYGGTPYYNKAQAVVTNAQNASFSGWKAFESLKNRYWLAENLNNKIFNPLREMLYTYHRNGLDIMYDNQTKGRQQIIAALPGLQKIDKMKQGSMLTQLFFTAKADELVNVVGQASPQDKIKTYNLLTSLDPANINKYNLLKK
ncbi:DUF4835 family protein [Pedobacter sp. BS3]|uniref:type IX secretion system protein PorD n=1 Tax=Pedobacter sp. BS3 TaxID=2567937 RepID=UPI0011EE34FC|nr:DUF4835 family protein [Pedobacter sp. BS3]TZF81899.1 DUF4835 family protein [Pedobacter sp. BS3]